MIRVKTAPTVEPLLFSDAAAHLRIDGVDDRDYVERLIVTARRRCEQFLGRAIGSQVQLLTLDGFTDSITLPNGPVVSVASISYMDAFEAVQSVTSFRLVGDVLTPVYGESWPAVLPVNGAVTIEYSTGYSDDEEAVPVPTEIISAMLLLISDLYENREAQIVGTNSKINPTVENLLMPYRVGMGV